MLLVFTFIPLITEIFYQSGLGNHMLYPYLFILLSGILVITNRNVELKISIKEAFIITVLSWILLAFLSAVPLFTKVNLSVVDAYLSL